MHPRGLLKRKSLELSMTADSVLSSWKKAIFASYLFEVHFKQCKGTLFPPNGDFFRMSHVLSKSTQITIPSLKLNNALV